MKRLTLLVLFLVLSACDPFQRVPPALPDQGYNPNPGWNALPFQNPGNLPPDSGNPSLPPPSDLHEWGVVKCHESQYDRFNEELKKFLSSFAHSRHLHVDCRGETAVKGGMFLRGSIQFKNGAFDPSSHSQFLEVDESSSYLEIHIVDINSQTQILKMQAIPYTTIQGLAVSLTFIDSKGEVFLKGSVQNNLFSGIFSYRNKVKVVGGTGFSGELGQFSISACQFLQCQSTLSLDSL